MAKNDGEEIKEKGTSELLNERRRRVVFKRKCRGGLIM
jgi:hypothetical protein